MIAASRLYPAGAMDDPHSILHRRCSRRIGFFWHAATNGIRTRPASCYACQAFTVLMNRNLRRARCLPQWQANRLTVDRFERAAMSQFCVATKTIVPVVKFQDFLSNGGVYEEAGWIAST